MDIARPDVKAHEMVPVTRPSRSRGTVPPYAIDVHRCSTRGSLEVLAIDAGAGACSPRDRGDSLARMYRMAAACLIVMSSACSKKHDEAANAAKPRACFDTHGRTSAAAKALFDRRRLQGGGPTWRSILEVVVRRHAEIVGARTDETPPVAADDEFRDAYQVRYGAATTWFSADDEGDGVRFCAGDPDLVRAVSGDFEQLNADPAALEHAVDQANGIE
jgi:hypothetical protein